MDQFETVETEGQEQLVQKNLSRLMRKVTFTA